jgi:hypothetical protein
MPRHPRFHDEQEVIRYAKWRARFDRDFRKSKLYKQVRIYLIVRCLSALLVIATIATVIIFAQRR